MGPAPVAQHPLDLLEGSLVVLPDVGGIVGGTPLPDAKQLVLFQLIPLSDAATIRRAVETLQRVCSKNALARIYAAINGGQRP